MPAWGDSSVWRVLDTEFADGARFFACWADWLKDSRPHRVLHYVALASRPPDTAALLAKQRAHGRLAQHAAEFARQWNGLEPGFQRLELCAGSVLLTVCLGHLPAMLREQQFMADAIVLADPAGPADPDGCAGAPLWDRWNLKALARLCRRGTSFQVIKPSPALLDTLTRIGVVLDDTATDVGRQGLFDPQWEPGNSRHLWRRDAPMPSDCAVVGAGLAGATSAAALARRGWRVTVLDTSPTPAAGASGLPAALMVPQLSRDDNTRSRLSRAGVNLTRQWCAALLRDGEDWAPVAVRQLFPANPHAEPVWHAGAAWIKPGRLVQACLDQPGVQFAGGASVDRAVRYQDCWALLDADGKELCRASQLVLAAASGAVPLSRRLRCADGQPLPGLAMLRPLQEVGGQISWGFQRNSDAGQFPTEPVNGRGHFLAHVPTDGARAWFLGATYEFAPAPRPDETTGHRENLERLGQLLPATAAALAERFQSGDLRSWHGTRCTTTDRLPAVGPMQTGAAPCVWMSAGMGSRGLTYAVLGAELLAAQLGGEPLPVAASLARLLVAARPGLSDHL